MLLCHENKKAMLIFCNIRKTLVLYIEIKKKSILEFLQWKLRAVAESGNQADSLQVSHVSTVMTAHGSLLFHTLTQRPNHAIAIELPKTLPALACPFFRGSSSQANNK